MKSEGTQTLSTYSEKERYRRAELPKGLMDINFTVDRATDGFIRVGQEFDANSGEYGYEVFIHENAIEYLFDMLLEARDMSPDNEDEAS